MTGGDYLVRFVLDGEDAKPFRYPGNWIEPSLPSIICGDCGLRAGSMMRSQRLFVICPACELEWDGAKIVSRMLSITSALVGAELHALQLAFTMSEGSNYMA